MNEAIIVSEEASAAINDDFSTTPLKKYITVVGDKRDNKWICNFGCRPDAFTGSYSRIRAHLIGLREGEKSKGIVLCSKLSSFDREKLKQVEEEARDVFGGDIRKRSKSDAPPLPPTEKRRTRTDLKLIESHQDEEPSAVAYDDIAATPLKKYISIVGDKKDNKWLCTFGCRPDAYTGSYSRVRAHLIGLEKGEKNRGIILCSKLSKSDREKLKQEEEEEARDMFGGDLRRRSRPDTQSLGKRRATTDLSNDPFRMPIDDTDTKIARFFYSCGVSFNVARSPFWIDAVKAINEAPRGYKAPSSEKIRTTLLDKEKTIVDNHLAIVKRNWSRYGVSIVADGWSNVRKNPVINVLAVCGGKSIFLTAVDCSGEEKTAIYIADVLLKVIETVGKYNVVQILTDDASNCKAAGEIISDKLPHVFWSSCMPHTLSLLLRDIVKSSVPCLNFVGICYKKVKDVINYIKNHSSLLHILRKFSSLEVILVKKLRFRHHYVVMERIHKLKDSLMTLVSSDEWESISKATLNSKLAHDEVKNVILDEKFWEDLKFVLSLMNPIWRMICFCESDKALIGEVYQRTEDMLSSIKETLAEHMDLSREIEDLVTKKWKRLDYPLHTLSYVLNPYYYSESWLQSFGPGNVKRVKPHSDPFIQSVYLDIVRKLTSAQDAPMVRKQLSNFTCDGGVFAKPEAIEDRKIMSSIEWWNLYGVAAPQLYSLAIKVLSQSVNSSCGEKEWSSYGFIESVKTNKLNSDRAESLAYVHYNNRILSRYEDDYEKKYKDWDRNTYEEYLEDDLEIIEDQELGVP